jgi:hypothetical protein
MTLAIAVIAVAAAAAVVISLIVWAKNRRQTPGTMEEWTDIERIRLDDDISEIRRGDRPEPPAPSKTPHPDNLEPFARPTSDDERR